MPTFPRSLALVILALLVVLAGCGTQVAPSADPTLTPESMPSPTADDPAALAEYTAAICPLFGRILGVDERLTALRAAGSGGGDVSGRAGEIGAVTDDLRAILADLEEVPAWGAGQRLTFELITSLHLVHTRLLGVGEEPAAPDAASRLAELPLLATEGMDVGMREATEAGLQCASLE